jgi:hypothetical protein
VGHFRRFERTPVTSAVTPKAANRVRRNIEVAMKILAPLDLSRFTSTGLMSQHEAS